MTQQQTDPSGKRLKDSLDVDKFNRYSLDRKFIREGWAKLLGEKNHAVYSCLCCHQNPGVPFLWISQQRIAEFLGIDLRTIKRSFNLLRKMSLISTYQLTLHDKKIIREWYIAHNKTPPMLKTRRKLKTYLLHPTEWLKVTPQPPLNESKK